jgi:CspA family cold shock protein
MTGVIKRLMTDKGFGFIREEDTNFEYFFHRSSVKDRGFDQLAEGDRVAFEEDDDHGKGPRAANVERY